MSTTPPAFSFPLLWTIGFSGKRDLPPCSEPKVAGALDQAIAFLIKKAAEQNSRLTAVSSIARGADVLFAQACLKEQTAPACALPWKAMLPFPLEPFLKRDLKDAPDDTERQRLRELAEDCLANARPAKPLVPDAPPGFDADNDEMRDTAYQECGYRVVDESDVMISVLRADEITKLLDAVAKRESLERERRKAWAAGEPLGSAILDKALKDFVECPKAGTLAVTLYAYASKHPCIVLNADAADPWKERKFLNSPEQNHPAEQWFNDRHVTSVIHEALAAPIPTTLEENPSDHETTKAHSGPDTPDRRKLWDLMGYLGHHADETQKTTQQGLQRMLALHLIATGVAATLATGLGLTSEGFHEWKEKAIWVVIGIAFLATCKPLFALWAARIEHKLEHKHHRENWLHARVLSELCRGMWAMWQLPKQPLDAADEEDFPKLKRLLRTLRLMRELDTTAGVQSQARQNAETQDEADMRAAAENYIRLRLHDQARYYGKAMKAAKKTQAANMKLFHTALWGTIIVGAIIAVKKWIKVCAAGHVATHHAPWADAFQWAELLVIMGPFLATYALARITILDCRRRARRFDEMQSFLLRLADTLRDCTSNSSRLRIIEHAERMMIEEQHEWFSTTRNFSV